MTTLLLADDHTLFRNGLRQLCEINGGFTVLAEATTAQEAVALARAHRPDVILMDIRMPGMTGIEAVRQIKREDPAAKIIILTMYQQDQHVAEAIRAGAKGYLLKNCTPETLFAAIHAVQRGDAMVDPAVMPTVLAQLARTAAPPAAQLTPQEMEVLRLVAHGVDNKGIAQKLALAQSTVGNLLNRIYEKLGVTNRTEAALYALRHGWATLDPED